MSWLFSQALVGEYSEATCLDGEPFAQLNVMPTQHKFWRNDKTMEFSNLSRFGLTLRLLTEQDGEALLTLFLAGFHAKTLAAQEKVQELTESEADCGATWQGSLAKYDPDTHSLKTAKFSLIEDSTGCCVTLPRWGSMRNGVLYQRPQPAHLICAKESGLLPTPSASAASPRKTGTWTGRYFIKPSGAKSQTRLEDVLRGRPNPIFLEWMMGQPLGMTDIRPLETAKFQEWQQQHSLSYQDKDAA